MRNRIVGRLETRGGQGDVPRPMQHQHQPPANHLAQSPVGLNPIPGLAEQDRQSAPAGPWMGRDQLAHKGDLFGPNLPAPVAH